MNTYPIAVLQKSGDPYAAGEFAAFVIGPDGRNVLSARDSAARDRRGAGTGPGRVAGMDLRARGAGGLLVVLPLVRDAGGRGRANFPESGPSESSVDALLLSLKTASISTVLCLLLGVPMALVSARCEFPGLAALRALVLLPLVLPPVGAGSRCSTPSAGTA